MKAEAFEESNKGMCVEDVADADDAGGSGETKADFILLKWMRLENGSAGRICLMDLDGLRTKIKEESSAIKQI